MQATTFQRVHIISRSGSWAVKKEGASRALKVYPTKEDAILGSYPYLQMGYDLVIHRKDGSVEQFKRADSMADSYPLMEFGKKQVARVAVGRSNKDGAAGKLRLKE